MEDFSKRKFKTMRRTYQIQCSSDKMVLDSGTILGSTTADEDDTVLLDVVACYR